MAEQNQDDTGGIAALRKRADLVPELEQKIQEQGRKLAVLESGLDAKDKMVGLFLKSYEGEWDSEALLSAAKEYDLAPKAPESPAQEQASNEVQAGLNRVFQTADGAGASTTPEHKPWMDARNSQEFLEKYDGPIAW